MSNEKTKRIVGLGILTAVVVVLQLLGSFIKIGPVSITLVLVPIIVGAAVYGPSAGAYLGGVFAVVVLFQPDTAAFHQVSVFGTVATVMLKGILCGWAGGLVYRAVSKKNVWLGIILAAICRRECGGSGRRARWRSRDWGLRRGRNVSPRGRSCAGASFSRSFRSARRSSISRGGGS